MKSLHRLQVDFPSYDPPEREVLSTMQSMRGTLVTQVFLIAREKALAQICEKTRAPPDNIKRGSQDKRAQYSERVAGYPC